VEHDASPWTAAIRRLARHLHLERGHRAAAAVRVGERTVSFAPSGLDYRDIVQTLERLAAGSVAALDRQAKH
jgi:hypothetical protein